MGSSMREKTKDMSQMSTRIRQLESAEQSMATKVMELTSQRDEMKEAIRTHSEEVTKYQQNISDLNVALNECRECETQLSSSLDVSDSKLQKVSVLCDELKRKNKDYEMQQSRL